MIDLLAMLAMPGAAPAAVPGAPVEEMTESDLTDFSGVLAAVVAQVAPTTPTIPPIPLAATPPTPPSAAPTLPTATTCDDSSNISRPSITRTPTTPVVVAVLPVPVALQAGPRAPIALADAQVAPETVDGAIGHTPVAHPATPASPSVANDVPEREGAPATAVVPEPALPMLEHPATLGGLGTGWGDGNARRRVDTAHPVAPLTAHPTAAPPADLTANPTAELSADLSPDAPVPTGGTTYRIPASPTASSVAVAATDLPPIATGGGTRRIPAPPTPSSVDEPVFTATPPATGGTTYRIPASPTASSVDESLLTPTPSPTGDVVVADEVVAAARPVAPDAVVMPTMSDAEIPELAATAEPAPMATATTAQAAAQANGAHATTNVERPERDRHVNGVAAPIRRAVEEAQKREGEYTMTIRLDPPELGTVRIRVVSHGERVHVTLHTELAEAKSELQLRQTDIADILRNEGFTLDGFDVDTSDRRSEQRESNDNARRGNANAASDFFDFANELATAPADGELRL